MSINQQQILSMLTLQDEMNSIVNPNWRKAGYNWARAIMVEGVEAIEHHGWKWWKKQEPNMPQLQMELVDIWHFALSMLMQHTEPGNAAQMLAVAENIEQCIIDAEASNESIQLEFNGELYSSQEQTLVDSIQMMVGLAAAGAFSTFAFHRCLAKAGMSWEELYANYVGKNVLNRFRQENGYKTGEYIKDWSALPIIKDREATVIHCAISNPLEDNDHLHDLMEQIGHDAIDLRSRLMSGLRDRYEAVKSCA